MRKGNDPSDPSQGRMSRRAFLHWSGITAAGLVLLGCNRRQPVAIHPTAPLLPTTPTTAPPTVTARPVETSPPAPSLQPTATTPPEPVGASHRPDIIRVYPQAPSRVVRARHAGVWDGDHLSQPALAHMLDAGITTLTGLKDARQAWSAIFRPEERVAIKVNTINGSCVWSHVPLVMLVIERLQWASVPAEQVVIYDRASYELEFAGFPMNADGPGVRCLGTDQAYTSGYEIMGTAVKLSDRLLGCHALINMPVLKQHGLAGISFALKNHYGTIDRPNAFHAPDRIKNGLPQLNALAEIKDRTRLVIGDATEVAIGDSWTSKAPTDSIFMSFDPLAHDYAGLQLFQEVMVASGAKPAAYIERANGWLAAGAELGLGTNNPQQMELVEVNLDEPDFSP